jgi:hypothetical protein
MRKPRDFDQALRELTDKAKALKENKRLKLGELVMATGADALDVELLAGGLLAIANSSDAAERERWRAQGTTFFRSKARKSKERSRDDRERAPTDASDSSPA